MLTGVRDGNTSVSSVSSADSTGNPGFETSTTSSRKRKYFTLPRNKSENKKKTQNKISKNDFYNKTIEFRLWLAEEKKIDFDTTTEKKLREHFKKFVKKWNNKKLAMKYYVGVDPMWAVSSPGAYSRTLTRTPDSSQDMDNCSLCDTSSMFGTFGKSTGRKMSEMLRNGTPPSSFDASDFTGIRTRSATRLDSGMPKQLRELFTAPDPDRMSSSVLSPKKRHASMEELSSPCKSKETDAGISTLTRNRSRSAVCRRYETPTVPTAQSMDNLTSWRNSFAEPKEEHVATILRRPGSRGSIARRSAPQTPNTPALRSSYAEAMNNSINSRNSIAESAMESQMDGVFKVPGCRSSFALKTRVPPPPPPRVPAKSMENLTAWRDQQVNNTINTPSLKRPGSRSSIASKKTPPPLPERRSSRLSNTSIASSQSLVVVDIPTDEPNRKSWLDEDVPVPFGSSARAKVGQREYTQKPMAPVIPIQGTPYHSTSTNVCRPPMSVQRKIPPAVPLRMPSASGSSTKPVAPVAPQPLAIETARFTRRSSSSSVGSRISVASVGSSSSESSSSSGTLLASNTSSSSSSSFQDAITAMAGRMNKSRKDRCSSSDSDMSSQGSVSSMSSISAQKEGKGKAVKKRPLPPPPKFKPVAPKSYDTPVVLAPAKESDKKKSTNKKGNGKAAVPPPPPPPPPPPLPQHVRNPAPIKGKSGDLSVKSGYKHSTKPAGNRPQPPLQDAGNFLASLKQHQQQRQQQSVTKSLGKKRQSQEDLNDLATAAKKLYTGTPTGVSPRHSSRVTKSRAVIESPKAVYV